MSFLVVLTGILLMAWTPVGHAADQDSDVKHIEDMVVKEKGGAPGIEQTPSETVIEIDKFTTIGPPSSIIDVLKTQAIVDFRGATDLEPGVDPVRQFEFRGIGRPRPDAGRRALPALSRRRRARLRDA